MWLSTARLLNVEQQFEVDDTAKARRAVHLVVGHVEQVGTAHLSRSVQALNGIVHLRVHILSRRHGADGEGRLVEETVCPESPGYKNRPSTGRGLPNSSK